MSRYSELIEAMITYKESLGFGYARRTYAGYLYDLAAYLDQMDIKGDAIVLEDILPWCRQRTTEKPGSYRRRFTAAREFTKYLFATGSCNDILSMDTVPSVHRYTPYIFSDAELKAIFSASDHQKGNSRYPLSSDIIAVIYRLIYFCGLRPNEGRELRLEDCDMGRQTLFIRENKSHKERLIPMADDISVLCERYLNRRNSLYPDSEYLFPSPNGQPYSSKWLARHFLELWYKSCPEKRSQRVRVYDLRHRFATAVLMEWLDHGENLYIALPYLSAYMGHSDFRDTTYYIHLLPERLLKTDAINWSRFSDLLPMVIDDE